ncbi:MAG: hypothetical protein [Bacteriophage sp.]|nr:MAG: hypothetical protein [Bacteriophage sp.]
MQVKEIKKAGIFAKDDIHCFTDCGYNCKARVKYELETVYTAMLEDLGEGWKVRTWHNAGWHCEAIHEATGFVVSDRALRGNPWRVKDDSDRYPDSVNRYSCNNYGDGTVAQVWTYGDTPRQAVDAAVAVLMARANASIALAGKLDGAL